MRGLIPNNNISSRKKSGCSFCQDTSHQATTCPHVKPMWRSLQRNVIPMDYIQARVQSNVWTPWRWMSNPHHWGDLYKAVEKANEMQIRYEARKKSKSKSTKKRITTCGFCGETGHTRRTCQHVGAMVETLAKAQKNYRRYAYRTYVEDLGLSDGALVRYTVQMSSGYGSNRREFNDYVTSLCLGVNWDTLNLFAEWEPRSYNWHDVRDNQDTLGCGSEKLDNIKSFFGSRVNLKVHANNPAIWSETTMSKNPVINIPVNGGSPETLEGNDLGWYDRPTLGRVEVISRAPQVLSEDWVDGYSDEMSIIFKKFSKAQLDFIGITAHIEEWANKDQ